MSAPGRNTIDPSGSGQPPSRIAIEDVSPAVDGGRFPVKRIVGDLVTVEARIFADGHDLLTCRLLHRRETDTEWSATAMTPLGNDRWRAGFRVLELGRYRYTLEAWVNRFGTWRRDMAARLAASQDIAVDVIIGAAMIEAAAARAAGRDQERLRAWARDLRAGGADQGALALDDDLAAVAIGYAGHESEARCEFDFPVIVDRERARFSSWYEVFPRSCTTSPERHGTLRDCVALVPDIAAMGFDVLYLPPIHPIGRKFRKGKNNAVESTPDDVGSPWAIGASEGGHTAIHPALGTLEDFLELVGTARGNGMEVALDLAFQCAPDHPYVTEHPEWFKHRPDGTIQYAENPPKKYQDIYPFDFDSPAWRALWEELRRVILVWIERGIRIFRVDNPHTKPYAFWDWVINDLKGAYPDLIVLSEAFTRPGPMYRLAKLGFTQSYTYFTWRNTKAELTEYFEGLSESGVREFFRPNLWPNTPDILHAYLQSGGRPAFMVRGVLAATLGANYGVYGPAFELCENEAREPGSEEYRDAEKYEIRYRELGRADTLRPLLTRLNQIRREHSALHADDSLQFHETDNPELICYSKSAVDTSHVVIVVVNLDPRYPQSGWVTLDLASLGLPGAAEYEVHDLLDGSRYRWYGERNFVRLIPGQAPAHILRAVPLPPQAARPSAAGRPLTGR
jgi:starch synthase (maltosyl-transferring)